MIYVLDASVLLKWFIEEPESPCALTYRTRLLEGTISIACPDLALYEVGNVLRHKRGIPPQALTQAITDLLHLELDIFTPTETLLRQAGHLAHERRLTFYDAVYLALAQELHATVVTADLKMYHHAHHIVSIEPLLTAR